MEAFILEFKEMKDSNNRLQQDMVSLTNTHKEKMEEMGDQVSEIKKENIALQQQVQLLQCKDGESKQSAKITQVTDSSNEEIIALDKKVETRCSKVEKSIKNLKKEFERGMTKIQEESCQLGRHQRVLSVLHVSLQARKDVENEVESLKTDVDNLKATGPMQYQRTILPLLALPDPPVGSVSCKHPSKKAISRVEARVLADQIADTIKRSTSSVCLANMPLLYNVPVCVEEYTEILTACDFMDPESGVYTVPLRGQYKLDVTFHEPGPKVYLCTDRDDQRQEIVYFHNAWGCLNVFPIHWSCEANDKIWLEAMGIQQVEDAFVSGVKFDVIKLYPDISAST